MLCGTCQSWPLYEHCHRSLATVRTPKQTGQTALIKKQGFYAVSAISDIPAVTTTPIAVPWTAKSASINEIPESWSAVPKTLSDGSITTLYEGHECVISSSSWDSRYQTQNVQLTSHALPAWQLLSNWEGVIPTNTHIEPIDVHTNTETSNPFGCCGDCLISWDQVIVRYWPELGANTDCLSDIKPVGTRLAHAIEEAMSYDTRVGEEPVLGKRGARGPPPSATRMQWMPMPSITPGPLLPRDNSTGPATLVGSDGFT